MTVFQEKFIYKRSPWARIGLWAVVHWTLLYCIPYLPTTQSWQNSKDGAWMGIKTSRPVWKPLIECYTIIPCDGIWIHLAVFVCCRLFCMSFFFFQTCWSLFLLKSIKTSHSILCFFLESQCTAIVMSILILLRSLRGSARHWCLLTISSVCITPNLQAK